MKFSARLFARLFTSMAALLAALWLSGCLALAVPSLAYQGYKYEKGKKQDQQASTQDPKQGKSAGNSGSDQYYDTE